MRFIVPGVLLLVGLVHLLPLVGVVGAGQIQRLYGVTVQDPNLEILLRHRAVLFGLLGLALAVAAFRPAWHTAALMGATLSVVSFLVLAWLVGGSNAAIATVVRVDVVAAVLLGAAWAVHIPGAGRA